MLSSKLQEAGLADIVPQAMINEIPLIQTQRPTIASHRKSQRTGSESSETPLGSLDRTKVSLGDSEQTTDSKRFIRYVLINTRYCFLRSSIYADIKSSHVIYIIKL